MFDFFYENAQIVQAVIFTILTFLSGMWVYYCTNSPITSKNKKGPSG